MNAALLEFDEPGRPSAPLGKDAPSVIADTLRSHGVDAPGSLYNEALNLAREGLLGPSSQRLQMLICLDPDDADAHLLLCKVYAAQGKPGEALARLEAAIEAGAVSPAGLREHLEGLIRADRQKDEEHRARVAAREQGEIKALRHEARNLRSETIRLEAEVTETKDRESMWRGVAMIAAGATVVAVLVFGVVTLFTAQGAEAAGAPEAPVAAVVAPPVPPEILSLQKQVVAAPAVAVAKPAAKPQAPAAAQVMAPTAAMPSAAKVAKPVADVKASMSLPASHVVVSGDSLYSLAGRYYGDKMEFGKIRDANKAVLKGGIALKLGMKLSIPK